MLAKIWGERERERGLRGCAGQSWMRAYPVIVGTTQSSMEHGTWTMHGQAGFIEAAARCATTQLHLHLHLH